VNGVFTPRNWKARARFGHTGPMMSTRYRLLALVLLAASAFSVQAAPHLYRFDRVHTQILFSVGHDGFSNALGMLHVAAGWMRFDPDDWSASSCRLDIDLAGVDMGDAA